MTVTFDLEVSLNPISCFIVSWKVIFFDFSPIKKSNLLSFILFSSLLDIPVQTEHLIPV